MNKKGKLILFALCVFVVGLLAWCFSSGEKAGVTKLVYQGDKQAIAVEEKQKRQFKELTELAKQEPGAVEKLIKEVSPKMAAMDEMGKAMNSSFQFYAKIVDQHGEAVPGVKVVYSMGGFGSFGQPFSKVSSVQSDGDGVFRLSGESTMSSDN